MDKRKNNYNELLNEIKEKIPKDTFKRLLSQKKCELEYDFLGFLEVYDQVRKVAPKECVIIDLGCYMAVQAYLFDEYRGYVGVDTVNYLERFCPTNCTHYEMDIQEFIEKEFPKMKGEKYFAVCSYVPDIEATTKAYETLDNVLIIYPGRKTLLKIDGEEIV